MKFSWKWFLWVWVLVGCGGTAEPAAIPSTPTVPPRPVLDSAEIALGQEIYQVHCASCHGANLEGEADWKTPNADGSFRSPPHDASGHTWHHSDSILIDSVKRGGERLAEMNVGGSSPMPAFEDILTDGEITAVLTYIKSTWPEDIRQIQWEATQMEK